MKQTSIWISLGFWILKLLPFFTRTLAMKIMLKSKKKDKGFWYKISKQYLETWYEKFKAIVDKNTPEDIDIAKQVNELLMGKAPSLPKIKTKQDSKGVKK